jgi:hypothetical protein
VGRTPSDGGSAQGDDEAGAGGSGEGGAQKDGSGPCNAIPNGAPLITQQRVASAAPTAQGGTITDGTWYLTACKLYTGAGGATGPTTYKLQRTWVISGNTVNVVRVHPPEAEQRFTVSAAVASGQWQWSLTCGDGNETTWAPFPYDATPTTLTIYEKDSSGTVQALVHTKQ